MCKKERASEEVAQPRVSAEMATQTGASLALKAKMPRKHVAFASHDSHLTITPRGSRELSTTSTTTVVDVPGVITPEGVPVVEESSANTEGTKPERVVHVLPYSELSERGLLWKVRAKNPKFRWPSSSSSGSAYEIDFSHPSYREMEAAKTKAILQKLRGPTS